MQVCGGPAGLQVTGTGLSHTGDSGAQGASRRAWGQRGGPRLAQGLGSPPLGPALPWALLGRVPQGGAQPVCTCRLAGWAEAALCWDGHSWVGRHPGWAHLLTLGRAGWGSGDGELRQHLACRPQPCGQGADRSMHAARLLTRLTGECETPARRPDRVLTQGHRKAGACRPGGRAQRGAQRTEDNPGPWGAGCGSHGRAPTSLSPGRQQTVLLKAEQAETHAPSCPPASGSKPA